jgi:hypothetical protein
LGIEAIKKNTMNNKNNLWNLWLRTLDNIKIARKDEGYRK